MFGVLRGSETTAPARRAGARSRGRGLAQDQTVAKHPHVALRGAHLVGDAARQQIERIDLVEWSGASMSSSSGAGASAARPIDDHRCVEASLLDPRRERAWQCARGQRCGCIESARAAAAVTLHESRVPKSAESVKCD